MSFLFALAAWGTLGTVPLLPCGAEGCCVVAVLLAPSLRSKPLPVPPGVREVLYAHRWDKVRGAGEPRRVGSAPSRAHPLNVCVPVRPGPVA